MSEPTAAPDAPLDTDVARWCEIAELHAIADLFAAAAEHVPAPGGARIGLAGGSLPLVASTALDISFFNRVVGLGIDSPATESLVDDALAFYAGHGLVNVGFSIAPQAQPSELGTWLQDRGFVIGFPWVKCWRGLDEVPSAKTDLRIERIGPDAADAFDAIVRDAFGLPPEIAGLAGSIVGRAGWTAYVGYDGDRAVSTAAMHVKDGVAWLGFGATHESARGRGGQSAMFAHRLRDARDLGCRLAITETGVDRPDDPNPSFHNMIRHGFRVAYDRPNWRRP